MEDKIMSAEEWMVDHRWRSLEQAMTDYATYVSQIQAKEAAWSRHKSLAYICNSDDEIAERKKFDTWFAKWKEDTK